MMYHCGGRGFLVLLLAGFVGCLREVQNSRGESNVLRDSYVKDTSSDIRHSSARAKRSTTNYHIDVLVILDYSFYQYWLNHESNDDSLAVLKAKQYVAYIFKGMNTRYASITSTDFLIHVNLCGFIIAKTPAESPWTETAKETGPSGTIQVNAETVLEKLKNYTRDHYSTLPENDHIMLFTEYDLYGADNGYRFDNAAGFAYVGTVCYSDGTSVSVVEDHGGFQSENTATHELGHSLGSKHDGEGNSCNSANRYIMAGGVQTETASTRLNPWHFSSCSVQSFQSHFTTLIAEGYESKCLLKEITPVGVPVVTGYPGQLAGPDEQCRQIYGASSYLCRGTKFGTPEDICVSMFCRNPSTISACTLNTAASGTCCGNGKWCISGSCVASQDAKCYMSVTCPFGQRQGPVLQNKTCDELEPGNCYDENFRQVCCEMCDKNRTSVYGCEYGDHVRNCETQYCDRSLPSGEPYNVKCCSTCNHTPTTPMPITTTVVSVSEVPPLEDLCRDNILVNSTETCSTFLSRTGPIYCNQPLIETGCCKTCNALKSDDPLCPYGDAAICTVLETSRVPCNTTRRQQCCKTCKDIDVRLGITSSAPTTPTTIPTAATAGSSPPTTPATVTEKCKEIPGLDTCGAEKTLTSAESSLVMLLCTMLVLARFVFV